MYIHVRRRPGKGTPVTWGHGPGAPFPRAPFSRA